MIRRQFLGLLFVILFVASTWSVMFAQAQGGNITTFSSGNQTETVTITSGQHAAVEFELNRNTTVTSASFFVSPSSSGSSVGALEIHANNDGAPEWAFNDTGYGDFGHQHVFASGNTTEQLVINPNTGNISNPQSPPFYLPSGATVSSASFNLTYAPDLAGGFFPVGYIHAVAKGDVNNDGNTDFALLSRTANLSSGNSSNPSSTTGAAFRIATYDAQSGITFTSWQPTCTNATRLMVADLDGDNHDDVIGYAPSDDQLCIHFTNASSTGFMPTVNVTHPASIIDLGFGDFTGNGLDEMISIRANGKVHVDMFSNRTNAFSERDSTTIQQSGSTGAVSLTHMLLAKFYGPSSNVVLMAAQANGVANEVFWSSNAIAVAAGTISGVEPGSLVGDFDGDTDLDIIAPLPYGHRSIENRANGWNGDNHNHLVSLVNATVLDYDRDFAAHLLVPDEGTVDGNPSTVTGNLTAYGFYNPSQNSQNRISSQSTAVFQPGTSPRDVHFGDMDGDGAIEQFVLAGEGSQHGVFISAYHEVGYALDSNGQSEVKAGGYAGDGSNGLQPLTVLDTMNELPTALNGLGTDLPYTLDNYGIQMAQVNFSMNALGDGVFNFSSLDVQYTANFLVNTNPSIASTLSNALNQQMTAGVGTFTIPLQFNTTSDGSFSVFDPTIIYVDGAPNIALPPDPVLQITDLRPDSATIGWQPVADFGDDLLEFYIYRSPSGQPIDLDNSYTATYVSSVVDQAVQPGQSWTYWVQSIHRYGVTSNLSAPLTVSIPYPTPKSYIPNLSAIDVPDDEGGAMAISWSAGDASIVEHLVYVLPNDFTDVGGLDTVLTANATTTSLLTEEDSTGASLVNGHAYYVAAIGLDEYGNASTNVTTIGPVYTRNDAALTTTLDVVYTDFSDNAVDGLVLLARSQPLVGVAHLHQNGTGIPDETLLLKVNGSEESYAIELTTNETGYAVLSLEALSELGPIDAVGPMHLNMMWEGDVGNATVQPLAPTANSTEAFGTVVVSLTADDPVAVSDSGAFSTVVDIAPEDATQNVLLANMAVTWHATDASGVKTDNGTAEVRGNELTIAGIGAYDGRLVIHLDTAPPTFYLPEFSTSFAFASAPDAGNETNTTDETNQTGPVFPDVTLPATVDCGTATYEWDSNATDVVITCTVTNPNPFDVMVGFAWKVVPGTPPAIELVHNEADGDTTSVTAEANGTVDLTFSLVRNSPTEGMFPGLQGEGYVVYLTCLDFGDNACDSMTEDTANTEGEIVWTLGEMPEQVVDDGPIEDEAEGAMTPVLVGIGLFIAIAVGVGGVLFLRSRGDLDFDDDDDDDEEDYFEQALAAPEPSVRSKSVDLGTSKSLDELKGSGKSLHTDAPEGLATSPSLGSSADAFEFGATTEDSLSAEEAHDEEESWDEEASEEDDGISVDENGTEWWEDEDGTWWYREEGWEDWAAWEE